jgi:hypothetical protein
MLRRLAPLSFCWFALACGAAGSALPAKSPGPPAAAEASSPTPSTPPASTKKPAGLGAAPAGLAPAPASCAGYAEPAPANCASGDVTERLAAALELDELARDRALACIEAGDNALPPGLLRALRADLAPRGCGDVVVGESASVPGAARDLADTLLALGVGARLYRSVREPPLPRAPFDKANFLKHFKEVLKPWIVAQAHAVDVLSQIGPRLGGYAKAIVALEAGLADMRFVTLARAIELPDEMKKDAEIRETYLVALEQALEPRVARGRDAALVGIGELARQGITRDARLEEARRLLSELYAGRRLDALDRLLLPPLPALSRDTPARKLAASLPAFYALKLEHPGELSDPKLLRARLERGVPPSLWLDSPGAGAAPRSAELAGLTQQALFQLGQLYFWAEPFARAAQVETPATDSNAALLTALAKILARGPRNAATMMLGSPTLPAELRNTAELDALAKAKAPTAGLAEFDAAYLRGLSPPANDPAFWKEQAARYQQAQHQLEAKAAKAIALELSKAARDTEKELRQQQAKP